MPAARWPTTPPTIPVDSKGSYEGAVRSFAVLVSASSRYEVLVVVVSRRLRRDSRSSPMSARATNWGQDVFPD